MDRSSEPDLSTFLVERYWPGVDLDALRAALHRLEAAAEAMSSDGRPVGHVASILMPDDEVVFSLITADHMLVVKELNERAGVPADRIAEAIALLGERPEPRPNEGSRP